VVATLAYRLGRIALAACAVVACGASYAFVPAANATSTIYGHAAAEYPIPPQSPHGEVRVASYGVEQLAPGDAPDQNLSTLHIRVFLSNTSEQTWTFDTREQQMQLQGRGTSTPAFASASPDPGGSSPPVIAIGPRATRLVDLFFPLPEDMQSAADIGAFSVTAHVHTDEGVVAETTPFERVETDSGSPYAYDYSVPQDDYNPYTYGYDYWDSPFWYNTGYAGFYGGVRFPGGFRGGHPVFARGHGWGRPGYYHGGGGGFHGGHGGGGHGGGGHGGGGHGGGGHGGGGHR
jgi:hypothetical protein